jgi:hypothetical protein
MARIKEAEDRKWTASGGKAEEKQRKSREINPRKRADQRKQANQRADLSCNVRIILS